MNYKCDNCGTKFSITSSGEHQDKITEEGLRTCPYCADFTLEEEEHNPPSKKWTWNKKEGFVTQ